ncbi:MAG: FAD-binding oxidoreductase [Hyphomicrobiaceae bacterium]|nr:FAD-binding oxidoreductase [Hyphomicrobiaceae bacterium]
MTSDLQTYQRDWLGIQSVELMGVARPENTEDVAAVLKLASGAGVPVTPQGGNTGLCAGSVPSGDGAIVLSMSRMRGILNINPAEFTVAVEAGVVLADLNQELAEHGVMLPLHIGSEGSAQIGGLVSTNAGGSHAHRHGTMQDLVLGLEVVLPNGEVWNGCRSVLKDNSGFQLRRLFCGAEGTLGIVTKATLKLAPIATEHATALVSLAEFQTAVEFGKRVRAVADNFLVGLEFFSNAGLELVLKNLSSPVFPLTVRGEVYVLIELSSACSQIPVGDLLESVLEEAFESGQLLDGAIASSEAQRTAFWKLREDIPEGQRLEAVQLKHDVSVPVSRLPQYIKETRERLEAELPGIQVNPFGHLADGNIHLNLTPPAGRDDFMNSAERLSNIVYDIAVEFGGSFAAEHGLGQTKVGVADRLRSPVERRLMAQIKQAVDPGNIMNPNVIIRS